MTTDPSNNHNNANVDPQLLKEFALVGSKNNFSKQAKFFLNAYWKEHKSEAETVWEFTQDCITFAKKSEQGCNLAEFEGHRFLEKQGQTLTAIAMREMLREIDVDNDGKMSLLEYCVFRYKVDVTELMERPQGVSKELEMAEEKLEQIQLKIKQITKYKKKWDKKAVPTGIKKMAYDNDMQTISDSEVFLTQALDFARKKLKSAANSSDSVSQGKIWWMQRELQEANKYAPPKKVQR